MNDDLAAFGVKLDPIEPDHFEVWRENWETVKIFGKLFTQWRSDSGYWTGLDYTAVEFLFKIYSVKRPVEVFEGLHAMEMEVMKTYAERRKKNGG